MQFFHDARQGSTGKHLNCPFFSVVNTVTRMTQHASSVISLLWGRTFLGEALYACLVRNGKENEPQMQNECECGWERANHNYPKPHGLKQNLRDEGLGCLDLLKSTFLCFKTRQVSFQA